MRKKKVSKERFTELFDGFHSLVVPWCEEHHLSLHKAFEASRESNRGVDKQRYNILSDLWHTPSGKLYMQSYFRTKGGRLGLKKEC